MVLIVNVIFSQPIYHPGEILMGIVVLEKGKGQYLTLSAIGKAKCQWGWGKQSRTSEETFYKGKTVVDLTDPVSYKTSHPGVCGYPFEFQLPQGLPSTFEGEYGEIYYKIKGVIGSSFCSFGDEDNAQFPFRMIGSYRLSPRSRVPIAWRNGGTESSNSCTCFGMSDDVEWIVKMARTGFHPGDLINFSIEIFNQSEKNLRRFYVKLVKLVTFIADELEKEMMKPLCKSNSLDYDDSEDTNCSRGESLRVKGQLVIPKRLDVICAGGRCTLITIEYLLKFKIKIGKHTLRTRVAIEIGDR